MSCDDWAIWRGPDLEAAECSSGQFLVSSGLEKVSVGLAIIPARLPKPVVDSDER